jgi:hypothetical protein
MPIVDYLHLIAAFHAEADASEEMAARAKKKAN